MIKRKELYFSSLIRKFVLGLGCFLCLVSGPEIGNATTTSTPTLHVDRPLKFLSVEGPEIEVPPGDYQLNPVGTSGLQFIPIHTQEPSSLVIQAVPITHSSQDLHTPKVILLHNEKEDQWTLVLLLPNGEGLTASGASKESGVESPLKKGKIERATPSSKKQLLPPLRTIQYAPPNVGLP